MTKARPVFRGDVIHIQRRTAGGHFYLVPKPALLRIARYAFAAAAERSGLLLHSVCVMSNHLHVIATDRRGEHPEFTAYAHRIMALALKRLYAIDENVWAPGGPSVQRVVERDAIIDTLAYIAINPVAAGCVRDESEYTGLFGASEAAPFATFAERIERPELFGESSTFPESAEFRIEPMKLLIDQLGEERAAEAIRSAIRRRRENAHREREAAGKGYLGMKRVLTADVRRSAPKPESGKLNPTFKGVIAEAIQRARETLLAFRRAYAEALELFREGKRDVAFPLGTYKMHRNYGVVVAALGEASRPSLLASAA